MHWYFVTKIVLPYCENSLFKTEQVIIVFWTKLYILVHCERSLEGTRRRESPFVVSFSLPPPCIVPPTLQSSNSPSPLTFYGMGFLHRLFTSSVRRRRLKVQDSLLYSASFFASEPSLSTQIGKKGLFLTSLFRFTAKSTKVCAREFRFLVLKTTVIRSSISLRHHLTVDRCSSWRYIFLSDRLCLL